jgi:transcription initiation factor TFIIB
MSQKLTVHIRCPECGGLHIIKDTEIGEFACSECGLVVKGKILDGGPEWRAFTPEEKQTKSRVGRPNKYSLYDKGLSTTIELSRAANVTEVTIRNRKKELVERLGLEEPGGSKLLSHNKRR